MDKTYRLTERDFETDIVLFIADKWMIVNRQYRYTGYRVGIWNKLAQRLKDRLHVENVPTTLRHALALTQSQITSIPHVGSKSFSAWCDLLDLYGLACGMSEQDIDLYLLPTLPKPVKSESLTVESCINFLISQGYCVILSQHK